jgi:hypothetical protein
VDAVVPAKNATEDILDVIVFVGVYMAVVANAFRNLIVGSICPCAVSNDVISV